MNTYLALTHKNSAGKIAAFLKLFHQTSVHRCMSMGARATPRTSKRVFLDESRKRG